MTHILGGFLTVLGILAMIALLLGAPLMILWNWLMPTIFDLPVITFWQAVGLNCISYIFFNKQAHKK